MFGAGGVTSMGSTFGFLGGRLWARGRLLAPPTASVEPHRDTHINATTANMQHQTPAILTMIVIIFFQWDCLGSCVLTFFLKSFPIPFVMPCLSSPSLSALYSQSALLNLKYRHRIA